MLNNPLSILLAASLLAIDVSGAVAQTTGNAEADQSILQRQRELLIQKRREQQKTRTLLEINPNTGQTETSAAAASSSTDSTVLSATPQPTTKKKVAASTPVSRQEAAIASIPVDLNPEDQLARPIKFAYDSAFLTTDARQILDGLCGTLKVDLNLNPGSSYFVIGHTDAAGSADYNKRLSQRRADATKQYLVSGCGITTAQLEAVGMGEQRLLANVDANAAGQRRVEIQVNVGEGG